MTLSTPVCRGHLVDSSAVSLIKQWKEACSVVLAFPPVTEHFWNWSNPQHTVNIILNDPSARNDSALIFEQLQQPTGVDGCPPLIIHQDRHAAKSGPTLFWCQATNAVGTSAILWPSDFASGSRESFTHEIVFCFDRRIFAISITQSPVLMSSFLGLIDRYLYLWLREIWLADDRY